MSVTKAKLTICYFYIVLNLTQGLPYSETGHGRFMVSWSTRFFPQTFDNNFHTFYARMANYASIEISLFLYLALSATSKIGQGFLALFWSVLKEPM